MNYFLHSATTPTNLFYSLNFPCVTSDIWQTEINWSCSSVTRFHHSRWKSHRQADKMKRNRKILVQKQTNNDVNQQFILHSVNGPIKTHANMWCYSEYNNLFHWNVQEKEMQWHLKESARFLMNRRNGWAFASFDMSQKCTLKMVI